jgi:HD-like signal output (HDOD) protein/CheY-like chemotaxis protein
MTDRGPPKKILFVDHAPQMAEGLKKMLGSQPADWDVQIVKSASLALERIATQTFDVVVADVSQAALGGVSVLRHVMENHPDTIRLSISGERGSEAAVRAPQVAQKILARPDDPARLKEAIERIARLKGQMRDENMRALISQIDGLPAIPAVCRELNTALARDEVSMRDVTAVVEKDPALTAKILQVVNSSFFGLGRRVVNLQDAVNYLGTSMLQGLVTGMSMWRAIEGIRPQVTAELERVQRRCQSTGLLARRMFDKDRFRAEEAFLSGLLHDVGLTLFLVYLPERLDRIRAVAVKEGKSDEAVEPGLYDITHAELGAYLLDSWGLPFNVIEAVAFHHRSSELGHTELDVVDAVHIAQALVYAHRRGGDVLAALDPAYTDRLGVTPAVLAQWVQWAKES